MIRLSFIRNGKLIAVNIATLYLTKFDFSKLISSWRRLNC